MTDLHRAGSPSGEAPRAVASGPSEDAGRSAPEYCTAILTLLKVSVKVTADMDLADHLLSFLNVALSSPEAQHALPLRKAFVHALLDLGLLNVLADISVMLDAYMDASVHLLRASVKEVIAVPKPEPLPAPKVARPPPPPSGPAKPCAPPPPPPPGGRKGPAKPLVPAKPRVDPGPKPLKKLKAFFWDVLPESRVPDTFWAANGPAYSSLDTQEVEDLFQAAQSKKVVERKAATKQLAILDVKRATGIGIRMSVLRARANEVADAVRKLDTRVLSSAEEARAILACAPAAEERKMFEAFLHSGGKPEALSDAERFCLELMQVSRLEERLSTYASSFEAAQQLEEASAALAVHTAAQAELCASGCFSAVLARTLALGNFLNWGSRLGQAPGFRLKTLPKLQDTRTADGRTNMLRYLAERLVSEEPPQAVLSMQVPHVLSAPLKTSLMEVGEVLERASMALIQIRSELQKAGTCVKLQLLLQCESGQQRIDVFLHCDNYSDVLAACAQDLTTSLAAAKEQLQQARRGFEALVAYFGENPVAFQNDGDFWRDILTFVTAFSAAQQNALAFNKEQQARSARQRAKSGSVPAGAMRRSQALPEQAQPSAGAEAAQHISAAPNAGQSPSGAAVQAVSESSESAQLAARSQSAVSLVNAKTGRDAPPAWAPAETETERLRQLTSKQAAIGPAEIPLSPGSRPANGRKADTSGPDPVQKRDGVKQTGHLRQKREPAAPQAGKGKESLIQAVPEMPNRKASMGWPDAKTGLNMVPPSRQTKDIPCSGQQDDCPDTRESGSDSGNETDLEALLGQLVNRAEQI